jgi:hypothetical protein
MRFLWKNYIKDTELLPSSSKVGFDIGDVKIPQRVRWFEFDGNDESLVIDQTELRPVEYFLVDVGNLTPGAVVTLEGNFTNSWTTPDFSTTLDYQKTVFMKEFDTRSYRFWRLSISEPTVTSIRIGFVSIGFNALQLPPLVSGASLFYNSTNESSFSLSGQVRGSVGYEYLNTSFDYTAIHETEYDINGRTVAGRKGILEFWSNMRNTNPFWCILWENNIDEYPPLLCVLDQTRLDFEKELGLKEYSTTLTLREVI